MLVALAVAILYPYILDQLLASPDDLLDASIQTLAYIIMALGLNIVVGFAGLLDLGYVAFFAIGAFVMGWLGLPAVPRRRRRQGHPHPHAGEVGLRLGVPGIHINFFFVIFIAAIFTAIWGVILGAPTLRLRGDYLAIVTLAFGEIVPRIFENSTSGIFGIGSIDFSNGRQGITPIDKVNFPWTDEKFRYPLELKPIYFVGAGDGRCSSSSSTAGCATRAWGARGSPCARTRWPPRRWASTSCARSCGPTRWAPRSAGSRASSWPPTTTRSTSTSSSSASRC